MYTVVTHLADTNLSVRALNACRELFKQCDTLNNYNFTVFNLLIVLRSLNSLKDVMQVPKVGEITYRELLDFYINYQHMLLHPHVQKNEFKRSFTEQQNSLREKANRYESIARAYRTRVNLRNHLQIRLNSGYTHDMLFDIENQLLSTGSLIRKLNS